MNKLSSSIFALLFCAALVPAAFAQEQTDKQVAVINGDPVMASELFTFAKVRNPNADLSNPDIRGKMIQAYVARELLFQDAITKKLDQLPVVQLALENQRHEVISQALISQIMRENPVTEEQMRSFYDQKAAENKADKNSTEPLLPYDQISPQIRQILAEQKLVEYVQSLQKKAKIDVTN